MRSAETGELYKATRLVMEEGRGIYDRMTTSVEPRDYEEYLAPPDRQPVSSQFVSGEESFVGAVENRSRG